MECAFCGVDPELICCVPHPTEGRSTLSCRACAIAQGVYCVVHERPHTGFDRGGTACLYCIEEEVQRRLSQASSAYLRVMMSVDEAEAEQIDDFADIAQCAMRDTSIGVAVLRWVVTEACRRKVMPEHILGEIEARRSAESITPCPPPD